MRRDWFDIRVDPRNPFRCTANCGNRHSLRLKSKLAAIWGAPRNGHQPIAPQVVLAGQRVVRPAPGSTISINRCPADDRQKNCSCPVDVPHRDRLPATADARYVVTGVATGDMRDKHPG